MKLFLYWFFVVVPSLLLCCAGVIILQEKWMLSALNADPTRSIDINASRYIISILFLSLPISLILLYKNFFVNRHKGKLSIGIAILGLICFGIATSIVK